MTFEHDGEKIVEKSFSFSKDANKEIKTGDFQFKDLENECAERIPIQGESLLDRCFEATIRKYCLFKGEENLNVFNNPDALNYLIETFSNIRQFELIIMERVTRLVLLIMLNINLEKRLK
jgi:DNA sulfur modification protein DndD